MKRLLMLGIFVMATVPGGLSFPQSSSQQAPPSQPDVSLADYARKLKEQQKATPPGAKPAKVYTNDDVQSIKGPAGVSVTSAPPPPAATEAAGGDGRAKYFKAQMGRLLGQKQLHERELEVLQKKLDINQIQFYSDPTQQLLQTSGPTARSDITKVQADVDAKKKEIENDDQAISDLQDQLRREGGDPAWLRDAVPSFESSTPTPATEASEEKNPEDKQKTKEYWQAKFRAARANLKKAEEVQKLSENEISLLQRRKVQEPSPDAQKQIDQDLSARQSELDAATAATDKAKQELDDLQKEFDDSGAPADWSVTD